jgi:hypothetical protein
VSKRSRPERPGSVATALDVNAAPTPVSARREPLLWSAVAVVLPLAGLCLGLLLLFGASVVSVQRLPWPEMAEPLYAHRLDLVAIGLGAIALALLWLNVTVVF